MFFFPLWIFLWHTTWGLAGDGVTEVSTRPQLFVWSTVVWYAQLPLALTSWLTSFLPLLLFSFPHYAITFKKQNQDALGKTNGFWDCCVKSQTLQCKLSNQANFPKCWYWVSLLSLIDTVQASSPGTEAHSIVCSCQEPVHSSHTDMRLKWQLQLSHAGAL